MVQSPTGEIVVRQPVKFLAFYGICKFIAFSKEPATCPYSQPLEFSQLF